MILVSKILFKIFNSLIVGGGNCGDNKIPIDFRFESIYIAYAYR